jgi:glycosyltransferase involved in cell wall biosynthesis
VRIAIDATPVVASRKGIGVVAEGLISSCGRDSPLGSAVIFVDSSFEREARRLWPGRNLVPVDIGSSLIWETVQLRRLLSQNSIELLITLRERTIVPGHTKSLVWLFEVPDHRVKLLLASDAGLYQRVVARHSVGRFERVARRTTRFVVSSEFTRQDLIERYAVPEDRITRIYPGVAPQFRETGASDNESPNLPRYVLHFATGDLRENSASAIRAFAAACDRIDPEVRLVLAGVPDHERASIAEITATLGIAPRTDVRGYIAASDMPGLFAGADVYLDPTLVEGFGLQLVEAMATGTCVIGSTSSSVPEIVGDAGILVAPDDVSGMSEALTVLLGNASERQARAERGRLRAARFSWETAAADFNNLVTTL